MQRRYDFPGMVVYCDEDNVFWWNQALNMDEIVDHPHIEALIHHLHLFWRKANLKCKGCQYEHCHTVWYTRNQTCGDCEHNGDPEECPLYGVPYDIDPCEECEEE